jgi:hypothetical protein
MEIPTDKKHFPWLWVAAGCGVVAIGALALATVAVIVFLALPAVRTAIANQSRALTPLTAPSIGSTAVPNSESGSGSSIGSLPFKFNSTQDPTALSNQSLMDQMVTSLNLNNDTDFLAPKTYKGTASLDPSTSFTLGNGWCAKDTATLRQNLANMQFQFSINGTNIDLSQYPTLYFTDNQGNACAMTGISITPNGNLSGSYHMVLTQRFLNSLADGITSSSYPAGDVTFDFNVQFHSTSNPGSGL